MRKAVRKKEKKNEIFNVGIGKKNRIIKKRIIVGIFKGRRERVLSKKIMKKGKKLRE